MFKSIRSRFTVIYFLLVFIAMLIAGVFIVHSTEEYNLKEASERLDNIAEIMLSELSKLEDDNLLNSQNDIQVSVDNHAKIGLREEIYVVDASTQTIVASSSDNANLSVQDILDDELVIEGMLGNVKEKNIDVSTSVRAKDKVYPIVLNGKLAGIMYLRFDLNDIYVNLSKTTNIILQATFISLIITIFLGFIISKSITDPINEITIKASKLAEGDFDQTVTVKSEDEIGMLGSTFNFLTYELKKGVTEIAREKNKLEAIIQYMQDGLIAIDADGIVIHSNPKAIEFLGDDGKLGDDIIGDLMSVYNSGKYENDIGSKIIYFESKTLKVNFAPYLDNYENKAGAVFVLQDITEEERLENMRKDFVANVSHELKTPLTSIKSYVETVLDGIEDVEVERSFLEVVNTEADRMSRLVRDLLELSNFDSDSVRLSLEENNVNRLINNCIFKVKATADHKDQAIIKTMPESSIIAIFDYDKIEQLMLNILSNAIKYTGECGIISVTLKKEFLEEKVFEIIIEDNGIGIPKEDMDRIYERFYRVDKARSRELGGTGLGLSIAKEIVEAHRGQINIESEYGHGTKVSIQIPVNM